MDHFATHFLKIGIVESYSLFGEQSSVYQENAWTNLISFNIEVSDKPLVTMFRKLVSNWNKYLMTAELSEIKQNIDEILPVLKEKEIAHQLEAVRAKLALILVNWNEATFNKIHSTISSIVQLSQENTPSQLQARIDQLERSIKFANQLKPSVGIQFTLADIAVAFAVTDENDFFKSQPVTIHVNKNGYLEGIDNPSSSVFYYSNVNKKKFSEIFIHFLLSADTP